MLCARLHEVIAVIWSASLESQTIQCNVLLYEQKNTSMSATKMSAAPVAYLQCSQANVFFVLTPLSCHCHEVMFKIGEGHGTGKIKEGKTRESSF